ncbi:MAG: 4Fe-4S dicluster domain-containing protein [Dehalococcoidia bacterium]|nr:4Fe-4S dicluster domain-containing protein [Dehalococcoidia bacterium]MYA52012.1 4Fe-4S dicluster domain-containing protein [Dehalococcoidia bacterium]
MTGWPLADDAPDTADLAKCVHCGLCVNACPTYAITGLEVESPRGRIHLARAVAEERIPLTEAVQGHWELCLQCRACEAVCPSGVPYGRIMERARAQVDAAPPAKGWQRRLRRFGLRNVIARPWVLAAAMAPVRWFARSPLRRLVQASGVLRLMGPLGRLEAQLGRPGRPFRPQDEAGAGNVALFTGCVMGELFGDVHRASVRVLQRSGASVFAPRGQGCCGALSAHDGDLEQARRLARANIASFEASGAETIVVNSAGCGAAMKEYGELLAEDPEYAERAEALAGRVVDFSEYLAGRDLPPGRLQGRVAYQDACHLAHAQGISAEPRALLGAVEGCELIETEGADMCCGAAGIYSLIEPGMSAELRARKAAQFEKHLPDIIVTANPGCQMQYEAAVREAGIEARVLHLAEALDSG